MPSLRIIAIALTLLMPIIHAITPAEVEVGRVDGFTAGTTSSHTSDYLRATYCFCTHPTTPSPTYTEANYLQFEYYNFHSNTTYILHDLCLADQISPITCLAPRAGDGIGTSSSRSRTEWPSKFCRDWYKPDVGDLLHRNKDTLCYEPDAANLRWREWMPPGEDKLHFNKQKRDLDSEGGQGPVLKTLKEAEDVCGGLCEVHAGMEALRGNVRAQCHVVVWEDLDDMCNGCA